MKKQKRVLREIYDVKKIAIIALTILVLFLLGYITLVKDHSTDSGSVNVNKELMNLLKF